MEFLALVGGSVLATLVLSLIEGGITGGVNESGESTIDIGGRVVASIFLPGFTQIFLICFICKSAYKKR